MSQQLWYTCEGNIQRIYVSSPSIKLIKENLCEDIDNLSSSTFDIK